MNKLFYNLATTNDLSRLRLAARMSHMFIWLILRDFVSNEKVHSRYAIYFNRRV
ncbi:MAG: hypothetical protein AAB682_01510 [Patescibacteria group bacterium]